MAENGDDLADTLEALIGAVYLDAGFDAANKLVRRLFDQVKITPTMSAAAKDAKTALQEWLQGRKMQLPQYEVVQVLGAATDGVLDLVVDAEKVVGRGALDLLEIGIEDPAVHLRKGVDGDRDPQAG